MTLAEQVGAVRRALYRSLEQRLASGGHRCFRDLQALKVVEVEGKRTQVALAERLLVDTAAASRLVARLEKDGLLLKKPGPDRRTSCLTVTPAGRKQVAVLRQVTDELDRELRRYLTVRELDALQGLLGKVQQALA